MLLSEKRGLGRLMVTTRKLRIEANQSFNLLAGVDTSLRSASLCEVTSVMDGGRASDSGRLTSARSKLDFLSLFLLSFSLGEEILLRLNAATVGDVFVVFVVFSASGDPRVAPAPPRIVALGVWRYSR